MCIALALTIGFTPGCAAIRLLWPRTGSLATLAAAPAVGAGVLYSTGELLSTLDLPVDWRLIAVLLLGSLPVLIRSWRAGFRIRIPRAVVGAWIAGAAIWGAGVRHWFAVPPHDDGYNHGLFVARLARLATLDPTLVMPHDVISGGHAINFYPLALHQQAATLVTGLHSDVATAWTVTTLTFVVVALPLGMYVLGQRLFPEEPRVWSLCAIVSALMPALTYSTSSWGGYSLAAGLAMAPGALCCLLLAVQRNRSSWRPLVLASLALAGLAGVHTSVYALLAVLGSLLCVGPPIANRDARRALRAASLLALCFLLSLVVLSPVLGQLVAGANERAYRLSLVKIPLKHAMLELVFQYFYEAPLTPAVVIAAFWLGLGICLRRRWILPWACAWALFGVLYVWLAWLPSDVSVSLTRAWYSDRFRICYVLAFLSIPFIAVALSGPTQPLSSRLRRTWRHTSVVATWVFVISVALISVRGIRTNYQAFSLVGSDQRAAFRFLKTHERPGEHVLNQPQDGSAWMYPLDGVAPVVALKPASFDGPEWADAFYLMRHVYDAGSDLRTDQLLTAFHVRYVYVNLRTFPEDKADINDTALRTSGRFRLVFARGDARIYEIQQRWLGPVS